MWLTALALIAALALGQQTWQLARRLAGREQQMLALKQLMADHLAQELAARNKQAALLEQQELVEKSVETGAASAQVVHKAVAGVTFGILDTMPATKGVSKVARGLHDGIADSIYAAVRSSNREFGGLAKGLLKVKGEYDTARRRESTAQRKVAPEPSTSVSEQAHEPATDRTGGPDEPDAS